MPVAERLKKRYEKFRAHGHFVEKTEPSVKRRCSPGLRRLIPVLYPLTFHPIFKERVWGGREIERLYGKKLPPGRPIGESWEISDRPGDASVITNGPLAGKTCAG